MTSLILIFTMCFTNLHVNINGVQVCGSVYSHNKNRTQWWPASTIKIFPAIAAWELLDRKKIRHYVYRSIVHSHNSSYDKLVDLVGRDRLTRWLVRHRYLSTWVSIPYGRRGRFLGKLPHPTCRSNCTSMRDLQRALLHAMRYKFLRQVLRRKHISPRLYGKAGYVRHHHYIRNIYIDGQSFTIAIPAKMSYNKLSKQLDRYIRRYYVRRIHRGLSTPRR